MANYYCEIIVEHGKYPPGVYTFEDDARYGLWDKPHTSIVALSHWVCKEATHGVVCIKDKLTGSRLPRMLTEDELKQFMWIKLRAKEVT